MRMLLRWGAGPRVWSCRDPAQLSPAGDTFRNIAVLRYVLCSRQNNDNTSDTTPSEDHSNPREQRRTVMR